MYPLRLTHSLNNHIIITGLSSMKQKRSPMLKKQDFYYELPEQLIAQHPLEKRDSSRLMVLKPDGSLPIHSVFSVLPDWLSSGDCLVINNTKVLPARLLGSKRGSGIACEVLLLRRVEGDVW